MISSLGSNPATDTDDMTEAEVEHHPFCRKEMETDWKQYSLGSLIAPAGHVKHVSEWRLFATSQFFRPTPCSHTMQYSAVAVA